MNEKIIQWGCKQLLHLGYTLKSNLPENLLSTPWSYVARFDTSDGYIYLKHTPDLIALEATVIQILQDQFQASVPKIIAHNAELNCFLMKDAGRSLREILKQAFNAALFCKAIDQFTSLQLAVAERVDVLLDIGVPDWRLDKFPDLYREALSQKDWLIADGLSEIEIEEFGALLPKVNYLCEKLSGYAIKPTIVQPDFNDNNTLVDDSSQKITLIDLGEIAISHPFFSLLNCLQQVKKHHALTDEDVAYQKIKDACFKNYKIFESKEDFADALESAQLLWIVYRILSLYRLMSACGIEKIISFQPGKLSSSLKEFMAASIAAGVT